MDPRPAPSASGARDSAALRRIGLTGGIGAGKSTVAELWRGTGAIVIDLDAHSRRVLDVPGEGVEEAVAAFGEGFRAAGGTIDRGRLAALVFADAAARARLEAIVLGRVDDAVRDEEAAAARGGHRWVVHDSPLLLEKRQDARYDRIVAVLAPREQRIARVVRDRGRDRAYAESVMDAQVRDVDRIRRADLLVLNNASREVLAARALAVLAAASGALR